MLFVVIICVFFIALDAILDNGACKSINLIYTFVRLKIKLATRETKN